MKINLEAFPEKGTFDFHPIGTNLTRDIVKEITKNWYEKQFEALLANGYGHVLIDDGTKSQAEVVNNTPTEKNAQK